MLAPIVNRIFAGTVAGKSRHRLIGLRVRRRAVPAGERYRCMGSWLRIAIRKRGTM